MDDKSYNTEVTPMVEFCKDHKCIKEKLDNIRDDKKFWHRIRDSKWFFWTVTGTIMLFIAFNSWVVTEIYAQKSDSKSITSIHKSVEEIKQENKAQDEKREADDRIRNQQREQDKKDVKVELERTQKEIKEDGARRDSQRERDQRELVRILIEIQKQIKAK